MNSTRLNIAIEVDDKGTVKIRQLGKTAEKAGAKAEKGFKKAGRTLGDFNKRATSSVGSIKKLYAAIAGATAVVALTAAMKKAIGLANEQEKVETRLAAVLKATGNASGYNIEQLKAMASSMQNVTTVGDEVILSGMSILATFKNVREEGFERATMAALDMSSVMGTDLNSSITQIGKALNDPIQGLTALSRVGVTFTDQQKEQIKVLQKSGDMMSAQNIILKELESEFGGAASAAVKDYNGKVSQLSNSYGDMWEQLGFTITKSDEFKGEIDSLRQEVEKFTVYIEAHREEIGGFFLLGVKGVHAMLDAVAELNKFVAWALGEILIAWDNLVRNFEIGAVTIKSAVFVAFDEITEKVADSWEAIYRVLDKIPGVTIEGGDEYVQHLRDMSTASEDYQKTVDRINASHDVLVAGLRKTQQELVLGQEATDNAAKSYKQFAGSADVAGLAAAEAGAGVKDLNTKTGDLNKNHHVCQWAKEATKCFDGVKKSALDTGKSYDVMAADWVRGKDVLTKNIIDQSDLLAPGTIVSINADLDKMFAAEQAGTDETAQYLHDRWKEAYDGIQGIVTDWIDNWEISTDSILKLFKHMLAEMLSAWAMSGLSELFLHHTTNGFSLSSLFGGSSGGGGGGNSNVTSLIPSSGLGSSIHDWVATNVSEGAADGLATLASGAAMVGGAYGMYSGVNNMAHGNVAVGAAQTGVGGYSMYQGAVGLDLVPEGTATQFASDVAGYLGYNGGQTTVAPYVSGQVYQQLGSEIGRTAGQEIGISLANNGSGLTTGIGSGMGMLSSYAGAGSAAAGEGTMMAAQGMYSGVGASGIGSGAGMMSSYAGAGAGAGAEMGSASMAGPMGWAAAIGIAMNTFLPGLPDLIAESTRKNSGIGLGTTVDHSNLISGNYSDIDMSNFGKKWKDVFSGIAETAMSDFGGLSEMTQQLGQNMDTTHVQQYLSTLAGVNVSMADTATTMQLAHDAAQGNETAFNQLYETLNGVMAATGDSTEYASASAYGLVDAMIAAGDATDATVGQLDGVSESFYTAQNAADSLAAAMVDSGIASEDTADQVSAAYGSGVEAVQAYISHMNGLDDEWLSSSDVMDEVRAAASGGAGALQTLINDLEGTGLSSSRAAQAAQAMTNAIRGFSNTNLNLEATARLNVEVQGAANVSSTISGASSLSSDRYFDPYDRYGDAEGSALGGVVERPTWFSPFNYAGEAGPELIAPLRHPKQMNHIEDKVDRLLAGISDRPMVIHLHNYVAGRQVEEIILPVVDRHIDSRERSGISGRAVYAAN